MFVPVIRSSGKLNNNLSIRSIHLCKYLCTQEKKLDFVVTSLRIDRVLATGFGLGRRKVEYNLLKGLIKLNGKSVVKKSIEVSEGDIVDQFSLEKTTDTVYHFDRIQLLEIGETTKKGKLKIKLQKARNLQIEKEEYFSLF